MALVIREAVTPIVIIICEAVPDSFGFSHNYKYSHSYN